MQPTVWAYDIVGGSSCRLVYCIVHFLGAEILSGLFVQATDLAPPKPQPHVEPTYRHVHVQIPQKVWKNFMFLILLDSLTKILTLDLRPLRRSIQTLVLWFTKKDRSVSSGIPAQLPSLSNPTCIDYYSVLDTAIDVFKLLSWRSIHFVRTTACLFYIYSGILWCEQRPACQPNK